MAGETPRQLRVRRSWRSCIRTSFRQARKLGTEALLAPAHRAGLTFRLFRNAHDEVRENPKAFASDKCTISVHRAHRSSSSLYAALCRPLRSSAPSSSSVTAIAKVSHSANLPRQRSAPWLIIARLIRFLSGPDDGAPPPPYGRAARIRLTHACFIQYTASATAITALGALEEFALGQLLRSIYLNASSPSYIKGISTGVLQQNQVALAADAGGEGGVIFDSAVALAQGLWSPTNAANSSLANGTSVVGPLNGYQVRSSASNIRGISANSDPAVRPEYARAGLLHA
jgi:hypothetical protein